MGILEGEKYSERWKWTKIIHAYHYV